MFYKILLLLVINLVCVTRATNSTTTPGPPPFDCTCSDGKELNTGDRHRVGCQICTCINRDNVLYEHIFCPDIYCFDLVWVDCCPVCPNGENCVVMWDNKEMILNIDEPVDVGNAICQCSRTKNLWWPFHVEYLRYGWCEPKMPPPGK